MKSCQKIKLLTTFTQNSLKDGWKILLVSGKKFKNLEKFVPLKLEQLYFVVSKCVNLLNLNPYLLCIMNKAKRLLPIARLDV